MHRESLQSHPSQRHNQAVAEGSGDLLVILPRRPGLRPPGVPCQLFVRESAGLLPHSLNSFPAHCVLRLAINHKASEALPAANSRDPCTAVVVPPRVRSVRQVSKLRSWGGLTTDRSRSEDDDVGDGNGEPRRCRMLLSCMLMTPLFPPDATPGFGRLMEG
jgi:hypothetical protein